MVNMDTRPGKRLQKTMERYTMLLMGKVTISTGPFSIAMLNYQRVSDILIPICCFIVTYIVGNMDILIPIWWIIRIPSS